MKEEKPSEIQQSTDVQSSAQYLQVWGVVDVSVIEWDSGVTARTGTRKDIAHHHQHLVASSLLASGWVPEWISVWVWAMEYKHRLASYYHPSTQRPSNRNLGWRMTSRVDICEYRCIE